MSPVASLVGGTNRPSWHHPGGDTRMKKGRQLFSGRKGWHRQLPTYRPGWHQPWWRHCMSPRLYLDIDNVMFLDDALTTPWQSNVNAMSHVSFLVTFFTSSKTFAVGYESVLKWLADTTLAVTYALTSVVPVIWVLVWSFGTVLTVFCRSFDDTVCRPLHPASIQRHTGESAVSRWSDNNPHPMRRYRAACMVYLLLRQCNLDSWMRRQRVRFRLRRKRVDRFVILWKLGCRQNAHYDLNVSK